MAPMSELLCWDRVQSYLQDLVPRRHPVLHEMEDRAAEIGFPIVGPACGHLCYQIARTIGARAVFELGSGFGYSTAWFARAVQENGGGVVHHVVWDEALSAEARSWLARLGYEGLVRFRVSEAVRALDEADAPFDLVFCDIDKEGYPAALPVVERKIRRGGVLVMDNLLWHGRVFDAADVSERTEAVRQLTRAVFSDPAWVASIVPIRDGMLVATRVG
jgi:predicted O-methyltransferase YrrM